MASFTEEIKQEIISNGIEGRKCKLAFLSAFIRTSGSVISKGGNFGFEIITESKSTATFLCEMLENDFSLTLDSAGIRYDNFTGRDKLNFTCVDENAGRVLSDLAIVRYRDDGVSLMFGIDDKIIPDVECVSAFLKGAFLGGGSCTLPDEGSYSRTGYHFEVVFSNKTTADDFCDMLCALDVLAKLVARKESAVVYVKSKEVISDLLNAMGTEKCLEKLNRLVELKDRTNNVNRASNCSVSNIDKTVTASVNQISAIETIRQTIGLKNLSPLLFEVAEARLADPNASMQELADRLKISKSCINHRMRKIAEMARSLSQD